MAQSSASLALFTSRPSPPPANEQPRGVLCAGSKESPQLCHLCQHHGSGLCSQQGKAASCHPTRLGTALMLVPQTQRQNVKEHTRVTTAMAGSAEWGRVWTTLLPTQLSGNKNRALHPPLTHRTPSSAGASPQGWVAQSQGTPVAPLPLS